MFYVQYLSSLCYRRQWPEPQYSAQLTRNGVKCVVRVNNREYHTDMAYENAILASENAAMRAYLICRNFSVNDGMYPSGTMSSQGGVLQGMPVAIGTERRVYNEDQESSSSSGSRSGGSSPGTYETRMMYGNDRARDSAGMALGYGESNRRR